jgi:molybdopterin converting factor small subunit
MTKVRVRYGTILAEVAGVRETEVALAEGESTLVGLLKRLAASGPKALAADLIDGHGRPACLITLNGRMVPPSKTTEASLQDGDKVSLIAPMSGGTDQR